MENIEQLKQDNAKLTERLNNAAKFFKDQKAQIDNLTKENKQLKDQIEGFENEFKSNEAYSDDLNKQIDILEAKLKEQNVKYSDLQNELENSLAAEAILRTDNDMLRKSDKENKEAYETEIVNKLNEYNIDLVCLAGYMKFCGKVLLDSYEGRIINIHPALLPAFKGAHGILDAYNYGVKVFGVTVHYVDSGVDSGKIIAQRSFDYVEGETLDEVEARIHQVEHELYPEVVQKLCKGE